MVVGRDKGYACEQHESDLVPGLAVKDVASPSCSIRALLTNEERLEDVVGWSFCHVKFMVLAGHLK